MRALEGIVYSAYSGSRFVLAGTPSGISLSREGGAHQSIITAGIGIETPGLTYAEPCYARELEWLLLDALARLQEPDGEALYLRLSTKPIDQAPFAALVARRGEEAVRADVVAGGFRLREAGRAGRRPGDARRRAARSCPRLLARGRPARRGRGRRGDGARASRRPTGSTATGSAARSAAAARRRPAAPSHLERARPPGRARACRSSP